MSSHDHIPQWKIAVAAGVVAVVAAAVAIIALVRGVVPGAGAPAPPEGALSSPSPAPAAPEAGEGERQRAGGRGSEGERPRAGGRGSDDAVIASIRTALETWETFARTADLDGVEKAFVVDGPQYQQFKREARNGKAGVSRVPGFSLQSVDAVELAGQRRRVVAHIALTGEDGTPEVREWVFVLQRVAGSWRVWTVIDQTGA